MRCMHLPLRGSGGNTACLLYTSYAQTPNPQDALEQLECDRETYYYTDVFVRGRYPNYADSFLKKKQVVLQKQEGDDEILAKGKVDFLAFSYYFTRIAPINPDNDPDLTDNERMLGKLENPYLQRTQWAVSYTHLIQGCCYLFLDEIQNVKNWQKCINALQVDVRCDIYITGSNAKLLSGELATYIAGRFVEIKVFPFSFKEYAAAQKDQNREIISKVLFQEYLQYGGMPFVSYLNDKEKFKEYMSGVFSTIVLNDMISRNNVRNPLIMERVLTYAIDNIGHLISASSIVKYLKNEQLKVSIDTVISYLKMGSDALLFQKTPRGNLLGKERCV